MADENGSEDASRPPEEEEQVEGTRRVKPLFRFGRKNNDKEANREEDEEAPSRVRPVRVVKFIPSVDKNSSKEPEEEGEAHVEEAETTEEVAPFDVQEEAPFTEAEVVEEVSPFVFEEEAPFTEGEGTPFDVVEEEATIDIEEEGEEAPFDAVDGAETPFDVQEEDAPFGEVEEEAPFGVQEEEVPFAEAEEEVAFAEAEAVPAVPFGAIEGVEREEPVHDSISVQEEAETEEEFQFRSEETPVTFETSKGEVASSEATTPPSEEAKPHYHKYLKPDEELLHLKQAKGRATGFDRDMDADAGEIDFGIDLIDPSDRKKKRKTPPRKEPEAGPKKGVGGHDFDSEVVTQQTGVDIGVDYQKRRKRRL